MDSIRDASWDYKAIDAAIDGTTSSRGPDPFEAQDVKSCAPSPIDEKSIPQWQADINEYVASIAYAEAPKVIVGYSFHGGDLFHVGHLHQLQECRKHCDYLIVGVLTDRALESYKRKPIIPYPWRAAIYEALRCVDEVVPQNGRDPTDNLRNIKPDVLFHGDDWTDFPGKEYIESIGGKAINTRYFYGLTTSGIIAAIKELVTK